MFTKNVQDVGFGASSLTIEDCCPGQDTGVDRVAICTEDNRADYEFAPPRNGEMQYVPVVVSSLCVAPAAGAVQPSRKRFMVERVQILQGSDALAVCQKHAVGAEIHS